MWELIQNNWTLIFAALFFVFMLRMHGGAGHGSHGMQGMQGMHSAAPKADANEHENGQPHGAQQEGPIPTEAGERPLLVGAESSAPGKNNSSSHAGERH